MRMMTKVGFHYTPIGTKELEQAVVIKDDPAQHYVLFGVKTDLT